MGVEQQRALLAAVKAHLSGYLGPPAGEAKLETAVGPLGLLRFEPMPGTQVLSTLGVSLLGGRGARWEAVLTLAAEPEEHVLAAACGILGAFAENAPGPRGPGKAFRPAGDTLAEVAFDSVVVAPPIAFADGLQRVPISGGDGVTVVWLVPAFDDEAAYARRHGPQAFLHLLEAQRVEPADFDRPPASTLVSPDDAALLAQGQSKNSGALPGQGGYKAEAVQGGLRVERRRRRIGEGASPDRERRGPPNAPKRAGPDHPPGRRPAVRGPQTGPGPKEKKGPIRFDLGKAKAPEQRPQAPAPKEPPLDPAEAKRRRVQELKEKALELQAWMASQKEGSATPSSASEAPETTTHTASPPKPRKTASVAAAERRRGRAGLGRRSPTP